MGNSVFKSKLRIQQITNSIQERRTEIQDGKITLENKTKEEIDVELLNFKKELQKCQQKLPKYKYIPSALELLEKVSEEFTNAHAKYVRSVKALTKNFEGEFPEHQLLSKEENVNNIEKIIANTEQDLEAMNKFLRNEPSQEETAFHLRKLLHLKNEVQSISSADDELLRKKVDSLQESITTTYQKALELNANYEKGENASGLTLLQEIKDKITRMQAQESNIPALDLEIIDGIAHQLEDYKIKLDLIKGTNIASTNERILTKLQEQQQLIADLEYRKCREQFMAIKNKLSKEELIEIIEKSIADLIKIKERIERKSYLNRDNFHEDVVLTINTFKIDQSMEVSENKVLFKLAQAKL